MIRDYYEMTKPRVTWLILVSTAIGYIYGQTSAFQPWLFFHCMMGTMVIASGTAALNMWYERESDKLMRRTAERPIAAGRVQPMPALLFGIALTIAGFLELYIGCNPITGWVGLATSLIYLLAYTPLKRITPHSTTVGAIPGAMPPLIGFAASYGNLPLQAWALFAILFVWQFPHFYAIAWMYREDYGRAGIRMLPVVQPDGRTTASWVLLTCMALIPVSIIPVLLNMAGEAYLIIALSAGVWFLYHCLKLSQDHSNTRARGVLLASVIYLPILYVTMVVNRFWLQ
jgi:heme o synthase